MSRFNVSFPVQDKVVSEEKGEPKESRTWAIPLTSRAPYHQAMPAHGVLWKVAGGLSHVDVELDEAMAERKLRKLSRRVSLMTVF